MSLVSLCRLLLRKESRLPALPCMDSMESSVIRAAILWVEDYEDFLGASLPYSQESAEGFACVLGIPASDVFLRTEGEVRQSLFMPPGVGQIAPVDIAPVLYYSGHGTDKGPQFNDGQVAEAREVFLGRNVVATVLDSCRVLSGFEEWKRAFSGMQYLLGFTVDVDQSQFRGPYFAGWLLEDLSFPQAWRKAATETKASAWMTLRAFLGTVEPADEGWPLGLPIRVGSAQLNFISRSEDTSPPIPASPADLSSDSIGLFRIERAVDLDWRSKLSGWFGLDGVEAIPRDRHLQLRTRKSSLEIFEESHSFWWEKRSRHPVRLFEVQPSPVEAGLSDERSHPELILNHLGLDAYRLEEPWETFTTESHQTQDSSESLSFHVARHQEFPLSLEGLPVLGPGARLRFSFDSSGLKEAFLFARKPSMEREVGILSKEIAKDRLLEAFNRVGEGVRIERWCLGYYALPPRESQDFLVPVYAFEGTITTDRLQGIRFVRYVQAVKDKDLKDLPEGSIFKRLPRVFQ
jgi:hypothetical protein